MAKTIEGQLTASQENERKLLIQKCSLQRKEVKVNLKKACRLMLEKLFIALERHPDDIHYCRLERRIYQFMIDIEKVDVEEKDIAEQIRDEILFKENAVDFNTKEFFDIEMDWKLLTSHY